MNVNVKTIKVALCLCLVCGVSHAGRKATVYHLGPTGLFGTVSKNQIHVTEVDKGSPADEKIKAGDAITGTGRGPFGENPRRELAAAINAAETEANGGTLLLTLKDGKQAKLQLAVLGRYSDTAPYNCPKSETIINDAAAFLIKSGNLGNSRLRMGLLGLMATGEQQHLDLVAKTIKEAAWAHPNPEDIEALLRGEKDMGYVGWYWGYNLIVLGEYYLLTKDESVLPAIRTYALGLARGQDAGGLYGHRMASPKRYGRLPGYAQMNQTSLSCFMGMLLAEKCGIDDPVLQKAIARSHAYFASFVGRGAFNYGVHGPNTKRFNNNGTSGSAAICMSIKGNNEGAAFFSQLSAPSYDGLEVGHASTFFNALWTPLGANLSGPEVTQAFFRASLWFQTLYRSWDGGFYRFSKNSREGPQAGAALLTYSLPRKVLVITGREADPAIWVKGDEVETVMERSKIDYASKTTPELLALMGDPFPQVTRAATWALRDKQENVVPTLEKMMLEGTKIEKLSALRYFGWKCPEAEQKAVLETMGAILRDTSEDPEVRAAAASSLAWLGEAAYPYYPDMVKMVVEEQPGDVFRDVDWTLGTSITQLCKEPFEAGVVKDKDLHYKAAISLARHKRQHARAEGLRMLAGMPLEDFHLVADTVLHVIEDKDPTYHSYHSPGGPVGAGISVLADLNIEEGLQYILDVLDAPSGKWGFKVRMVAATLPKYGANGKATLKTLQADKRLENIENNRRLGGPWRRMLREIEQDTNPKTLISLTEAIAIGEKQ